jgi:SAM-dependent MidA family methyltransferase
MSTGGKGMKLLKVNDNCGHYRDDNGNYSPIDKIGKEDLLRLVNWTLHEKVVEFDDYDEKAIKNQAHQIIYKSIVQKLRTLRDRRKEFIDESARLFLEDYEKYRDDSRK